MKKRSGALVLILLAAGMVNLVSCGGSSRVAEPSAETTGNGGQRAPDAKPRYASRSAEFITIRNPHELKHTGSPRGPAQVGAEMSLGRDLVLVIEDYIRQNGLRKTVTELNKGRSGELGRYMPESHFYLSFSVNQGERMHWKIIAHPTLPAAVGYDIPDLGMVKDNTGWSYNAEMLEALAANPTKIGIIEDLIWTDPEWSSHSCRMNAYTNIFAYQGNRYTLYYAVWLDK